MQRMFTFNLDTDENEKLVGYLDCFVLAENNTCEQILEEVYSPERGCYWLLTDNDELSMKDFAKKVDVYVETEKKALSKMIKALWKALTEYGRGDFDA